MKIIRQKEFGDSLGLKLKPKRVEGEDENGRYFKVVVKQKDGTTTIEKHYYPKNPGFIKE